MQIKSILIFLFCSSFYLGISQDNSEDEFFDFGNRTSDSIALVEFYYAAEGHLWKQDWDFSEPMSEWYGIQLNEFGRVFCIDLDGDANCTAVKAGGNHLHSTLVDLNLPFLEHLFLSSNVLSDSIPNFSRTPFLLTLQLSGNRFTGSIPNFDRLKNLVKLDLEYNNLEGIIPDFTNMPKLEAIYLGHNFLEGKIPSFEFSSLLVQVLLEYNLLEEFPKDFKGLEELRQMDLSHNFIQKYFPDFRLNPSIEQLDFSYNDFLGCINYAFISDINDVELIGNDITHCSPMEITIPKGFSPNGDGVNDFWEIEVSDPEDKGLRVDVVVIDRFKNLIYKSNDYKNDWNGFRSDNNVPANEGIYFYKVEIGKKEKCAGWLVIKRE